MMSSVQPLVSVLVPLRNSAKTFDYALASVAAQDYENIEVLLSDNCSSDDTPVLAHAFAVLDPRRRFVRQDAPLAVFDHFSRLVALSRGKYIVFCADDDYRDSNYISVLVAALESRPEAVLAFGKTFIFGEDRNIFVEKEHHFETVGRRPLSRILYGTRHRCYHFYGLWRGDCLRALPMLNCLHWPDMPLMLSAAVHGVFVKSDATGFYYREVPKTMAVRLKEQSLAPGASLLRREWSLASAVARSLYPLGGAPAVCVALISLGWRELVATLYPLTPSFARRFWSRHVRGRAV
jgi:glycosyltransferase involved in cell wall biosynthesis